MAKRAKGNTRKLLVALAEIQDLIGVADAAIHNDRDNMRMDKIEPALRKAFRIAVEAQGDYAPVRIKKSEAS